MHKFPKQEYENRIERLKQVMEKNSVESVYLSSGISFQYFTGFGYLATERPACMVITKSGDITFMGPSVEKEHIASQSDLVTDVKTYLDYPGEEHPASLFAKWIKQLELPENMGVESREFYPSYYGYEGPEMREALPGMTLKPMGREIYELRRIKSGNEIEAIRETIKWGNLAHTYLQDLSEDGKYEFEVSVEASLKASIALKRTLGKSYMQKRFLSTPVEAVFMGQVGDHSSYPHSISVDRPMRRGDILGTWAYSDIEGYFSELERNMFLGEPSDELRRYHQLLLGLQQTAFDSIKPGALCSDVDKAVQKYAKEHDVFQYLRHHSGHNIGLDMHEAPFLDVGDDTPLEPGMVFSVEPGLYVPGLGGFRHSDTVVMKEDGPEIMTYYPRDTDELIIGR